MDTATDTVMTRAYVVPFFRLNVVPNLLIAEAMRAFVAGVGFWGAAKALGVGL